MLLWWHIKYYVKVLEGSFVSLTSQQCSRLVVLVFDDRLLKEMHRPHIFDFSHECNLCVKQFFKVFIGT